MAKPNGIIKLDGYYQLLGLRLSICFYCIRVLKPRWSLTVRRILILIVAMSRPQRVLPPGVSDWTRFDRHGWHARVWAVKFSLTLYFLQRFANRPLLADGAMPFNA